MSEPPSTAAAASLESLASDSPPTKTVASDLPEVTELDEEEDSDDYRDIEERSRVPPPGKHRKFNSGISSFLSVQEEEEDETGGFEDEEEDEDEDSPNEKSSLTALLLGGGIDDEGVAEDEEEDEEGEYVHQDHSSGSTSQSNGSSISIVGEKRTRESDGDVADDEEAEPVKKAKV